MHILSKKCAVCCASVYSLLAAHCWYLPRTPFVITGSRCYQKVNRGRYQQWAARRLYALAQHCAYNTWQAWQGGKSSGSRSHQLSTSLQTRLLRDDTPATLTHLVIATYTKWARTWCTGSQCSSSPTYIVSREDSGTEVKCGLLLTKKCGASSLFMRLQQLCSAKSPSSWTALSIPMLHAPHSILAPCVPSSTDVRKLDEPIRQMRFCKANIQPPAHDRTW